jgi:hypothetical protein
VGKPQRPISDFQGQGDEYRVFEKVSGTLAAVLRHQRLFLAGSTEKPWQSSSRRLVRNIQSRIPRERRLFVGAREKIEEYFAERELWNRKGLAPSRPAPLDFLLEISRKIARLEESTMDPTNRERVRGLAA